jgi:hypothetical protein
LILSITASMLVFISPTQNPIQDNENRVSKW